MQLFLTNNLQSSNKLILDKNETFLGEDSCFINYTHSLNPTADKNCSELKTHKPLNND